GNHCGAPSPGPHTETWVKLSKFFSQKDVAREGRTMLVLSRKLGEKICIGENIRITVVDVERGKIRLGIEAPREIPIFRQELLTPAANERPLVVETPAAQK